MAIAETAKSQGDNSSESRPLLGWQPESAAWEALIGRATERNIFYVPAFALAAARSLLAARAANTIGIWRNGALAGLFPGSLAGGALPVWRALAHPYGPLSTPLVDRFSLESTLGSWIDAVAALHPRPRAILLPLMTDDGPVAGALSRLLAQRGLEFVRLDAHRRAALVPTAGAATPSGKRRKELARLRRRLEETGTPTLAIAPADAPIAEAIDTYISLERTGWKGRGGSALAADPDAEAFFRQAITALAAKGEAEIAVTRLDGAPLAATVTLRSGPQAWYWKTAYDETHARFSPGVLATLDLTARLAADPTLAQVDSCAIAGHPMIDRLWSGRLAVSDWIVALPPAGAGFALVVARERLRRAARRAARRMRDALRAMFHGR
ncbi:GNAT family N-acetyltransferase [Blastochloris sulfoviridis]|uniref:GNAT family N-acetyltransferase n=1 Tax=Blastochloris sulfoviridis TaxID=50712 RepID=A0A5M6I5D1_9HYPH|nr:GNAT family N-acetyltransferase [Blastochloris sulfoviridis]KAA5603402.1 GNAT family N-acetyltransferase [Blastochloris sulfoviridis]